MIRLEDLADGSKTDRNFQKLRDLVIDTGGQSVGIRFGTAQVEWPGGATNNFSAPEVVSHGLGTTPVVVLLTNSGNSGVTLAPVGSTGSVDADSFNLFVNTVDGTSPADTATSDFHWLVIG